MTLLCRICYNVDILHEGVVGIRIILMRLNRHHDLQTVRFALINKTHVEPFLALHGEISLEKDCFP